MACTVDGCTKSIHARKMCGMHYERVRVHGNPHANNRVKDTEQTFRESTRKDSNGCLVWMGGLNNSGYGIITYQKKQIRAHRYAWMRSKGSIPEGMHIDHTCFNRACVNVDHLRLATIKQNSENRSGASPINKSSKRRGVSWDKGRKKWMAHVTHHGKFIFLGRFDTIDEASEVSSAKRSEIFTHSQEF